MEESCCQPFEQIKMNNFWLQEVRPEIIHYYDYQRNLISEISRKLDYFLFSDLKHNMQYIKITQERKKGILR